MELPFYSTYMKNVGKDKHFTIRKAVAQEAMEKGIKPTARRFGVSKNTVKLWLRRYQKEGNDGLMDRRAGPHNIPHKTSAENEARILEIRKTAPCYGPKRLKHFFDLEPSIGAIQRIIKQHGLVRKVRRRHQKKNDLREVKARSYKAFEKLQMDIKYLTDIPPYWEQMQRFKLPKFQYTVRDVKSGMLFLGYADEVSEINARTMIHHILEQITPRFKGTVIVQTDNGVEFNGTTKNIEQNHFGYAVRETGSRHVYIAPGCCNMNGDVESIHATIEEEFYNMTHFGSREDFFRKAESYRQFYNLERPNYSKGAKTPWLIAQQDHPDCDLASLAQFIGVIDLKGIPKFYPSGGQPLPVLPDLILKKICGNREICP
jgi:transposase